MTSPADHVNKIVGDLAKLAHLEPKAWTQPIIPGAYFSVDPDAQVEALNISTNPDEILTAELRSSRPGRWATLNFDLGSGSLSDTKVLGLAMRVVASQTMPIRAAVRTFNDDRSVDTPFDSFGLIGAGTATRTGALWTGDEPALCRPARWRTLILFLDPAGFRFSLRDLHVFA